MAGRSGNDGLVEGRDVGTCGLVAGREDGWKEGFEGFEGFDWVIGLRLALEVGLTVGRGLEELALLRELPPRELSPRLVLSSRAMASVMRRGRQHSWARMIFAIIFMIQGMVGDYFSSLDEAAAAGGRLTTCTLRSGWGSSSMVWSRLDQVKL